MFPQVVVVAGGLGTRLGPAYSNIPKILAPVNGKPFLVLQLEKLIDAGVEHVHYLLGYKSELVISLLMESSFPIEISHTIEPPELLGTGGALLNAIDELDKEFFLTYGDSYLLADFNAVNSRADHSGFSNTMCVTEAVDEESFFIQLVLVSNCQLGNLRTIIIVETINVIHYSPRFSLHSNQDQEIL